MVNVETRVIIHDETVKLNWKPFFVGGSDILLILYLIYIEYA